MRKTKITKHITELSPSEVSEWLTTEEGRQWLDDRLPALHNDYGIRNRPWMTIKDDTAVCVDRMVWHPGDPVFPPVREKNERA